jgi:NADH-quinone oxidoreductase subunit G
LAEAMSHRKLFNDKDELDSSLLNQINLFLEKDISIKSNEIKKLNFEEEILKITNDDYYYSNVIARASKTMFECKNSKINLKSTGTEG